MTQCNWLEVKFISWIFLHAEQSTQGSDLSTTDASSTGVDTTMSVVGSTMTGSTDGITIGGSTTMIQSTDSVTAGEETTTLSGTTGGSSVETTVTMGKLTFTFVCIYV